jgi:DNA-binding NarL/FixJ family response regulator
MGNDAVDNVRADSDTTTIRVLIADDHLLVGAGIKHILEDETDFNVVGMAVDGYEALDMVASTQPDVVLLDIAMPRMDGVEVMKCLLKGERRPEVRVIVLTAYSDEHHAARLLRMGAAGYVVKDTAPSELAEAIRTVFAGGRYISASLREAMANSFVSGLVEQPQDVLTTREFQVACRLAAGAKNREIAAEMGISVKTIDTHRFNLLLKLGLRNNAELTRLAIQHGMVKS